MTKNIHLFLYIKNKKRKWNFEYIHVDYNYLLKYCTTYNTINKNVIIYFLFLFTQNLNESRAYKQRNIIYLFEIKKNLIFFSRNFIFLINFNSNFF